MTDRSSNRRHGGPPWDEESFDRLRSTIRPELEPAARDVLADAVRALEGWRESAGVQAEIRIAGELGKPMWYVSPQIGDGTPTLAHVATGTSG